MEKRDSKIEALLASIESKRTKLGSKPSKPLLTNGIFKYNDRDHVNINVISDVNKFVDMYAFILADYVAKEEAVKALGIEDYIYSFSGFTFGQWESDIKYKVSLIKWNEENKNLAALEAKLATYISEDKKVENELSKIEKLLEG
jgi:hypothetical protein